MANKDLNRLKLVLVEQKKTTKWLAGEIDKDPATVSKWCTNTAQPSLETLSIIAEKLDVGYTGAITAVKSRQSASSSKHGINLDIIIKR